MVGAAAAVFPTMFQAKDVDDMTMQLGPIIKDVKRRVCTAGDVTAGVVNLFTTPDSPPDGQTQGKVSGSFPHYELWYIQSAVAVILNPSTGTKDGVKVRIQAISGDQGVNRADMILADGIQYHYHYVNYLGGVLVPFGVYVEVDKGGFDANDILNFVVNYRKVTHE